MVTIENDCFSISQICESGQCFRLDPVSENIYELIAADRYLEIEIQRGEDGREKTVFSCTQEEYSRFWKTYFDLDASYSDYIKQIEGCSGIWQTHPDSQTEYMGNDSYVHSFPAE